jgi:hypothetical protein
MNDATAANGREAAPGFFGILGNLYIAPSEAFAAILKRPTVLVPLLLVMAMNAAFTVAWLQKVDGEAFMKARFAENPRARDMPAEARAQAIEAQVKTLPYYIGIGPVALVIIAVIMASGLMFVFRFFYAGDVTFRQSMSMVTWVFLATSIVTIPLMYLTLVLKDDWTVQPQEVLQANPSLFVERGQIAAPLFSLLGSLDLFSFWTIALLAIGFGLAARKPFGSAVWGVATPWLLYVLCKAGFAAMFG